MLEDGSLAWQGLKRLAPLHWPSSQIAVFHACNLSSALQFQNIVFNLHGTFIFIKILTPWILWSLLPLDCQLFLPEQASPYGLAPSHSTCLLEQKAPNHSQNGSDPAQFTSQREFNLETACSPVFNSALNLASGLQIFVQSCLCSPRILQYHLEVQSIEMFASCACRSLSAPSSNLRER